MANHINHNMSRAVALNLIKHSCSFIKQYIMVLIINFQHTYSSTNPKVEGIWRRCVGYVIIDITKIIIIFFTTEHGWISLCYANAMICSVTILSSSTDHHHCTIQLPITPKPNVIATLKITATIVLSESRRRVILTACIVNNFTLSKTLVTCPFCSNMKGSITGNFRSEWYTLETTGCRL